MARILITGSTDGFGFEAARQLIERKHQVYLHARNQQRADEVKTKLPGAAGVLIADLTTVAESRKLAEEVNAIGTFDAVFLNAGLFHGPFRKSDLGVPASVFVNLVSPYIFAALLTPPKRLIFIASVLHHEADTSLKDIFWLERGEKGWDEFPAYCDAKFHIVLLVNALARRLKNTSVIAMHPGYVPTKLSDPNAPDKMEDGIETYVMLAEGDYDTTLTGVYFDPKRERAQPHALTADQDKQEAVVKACEDLTGVKLQSS
ncbi:hypothetical protein FVEN_g752 [Fusarium venenatum]|uniref:Uncharacterized protein n=1 Tax=Fusarium venenatum TaxID=56646 RepID=A0A2L2TZS1_9HYPO|nr:uncharacterized protein FVRRES_10843 [Fusarium venenatum]KAG8361578.1 hypothetical protein FVEN_g752 [Fusarium venenatum]KAH6967417.1 hypothetical protein EDB82DRAFT_518487 [Fusarium venenatum]CEI70766.1 unnamed protein product [Fusarium venenatum]